MNKENWLRPSHSWFAHMFWYMFLRLFLYKGSWQLKVSLLVEVGWSWSLRWIFITFIRKLRSEWGRDRWGRNRIYKLPSPLAIYTDTNSSCFRPQCFVSPWLCSEGRKQRREDTPPRQCDQDQSVLSRRQVPFCELSLPWAQACGPNTPGSHLSTLAPVSPHLFGEDPPKLSWSPFLWPSCCSRLLLIQFQGLIRLHWIYSN